MGTHALTGDQFLTAVAIEISQQQKVCLRPFSVDFMFFPDALALIIL
jgi:hypothetical protein